MAMAAYNTQFTLQNITNQVSNGLTTVEQQMNSQLAALQSNPNPSPQQLAIFQATMSTWTTMIQMESSIIKVYGDTMKQVVNNMGG